MDAPVPVSLSGPQIVTMNCTVCGRSRRSRRTDAHIRILRLGQDYLSIGSILTRRCFAPSLTLCLILRPKLQPLKHTVTVVKGLLGKLKSLGRQPLNFWLVQLSLYQLCLD